MTKVDHRFGTTPRRTDQAYEGAKVKELAYFDAKFHMANKRNKAPTLSLSRAGKLNPSVVKKD